MAEKHQYYNITDVRGGMNNTDEPQSLPENQVVDARNIDWELGTLGGKRAGCQSLSIDNSVLNRVVPAASSITTKTVTGVNNTTLNIPAATNDGTGTSFTYLIVKIVNKPLATTITAITIGGVAMTANGSNGNANTGRNEIYYKANKSLSAETLSITWSGNVDATIIAEFWQRADAISASTAANGNGTLASNSLATNPTFILGDSMAWGVGAATSPNGVAQFQLANLNVVNTNGASSWSVGTKPTKFMDWVLGAAVDWATLVYTLRGAPISNFPTLGVVILALLRHTPTINPTEDELWMVDVFGRIDRRVGGTWQTGVPYINAYPGVYDATGFDINGASLHGKFFIAASSAVNGTMVWDGTNLRFAGFPNVPAAPTVGNTAPAGTYSGTRYFRIRYVEQVGGAVVRRSEPTTAVTFAPSGANTGAVITKPAGTEAYNSLYSNGQTHWEVEASLDNALFYRIATVAIGTATYTDTTALSTTYASNPLSDAIGENVAPYGTRHLVVDEDRLVMAGHRYTPALDSRVQWTPVGNATGVGNDERVPATTANRLDLDNLSGGNIMAMVAGESGNIYVFKLERTYKLTRTGILTAAYAPQTESKSRGATKCAAVSGHDQNGNPCVYFYDQSVGLCRVGKFGIQEIGSSMANTWDTVDTQGPSAGRGPRLIYWANKRQVWIAVPFVGGVNPTKIVVYSTKFGDGENTGYSIYESPLMTNGIFAMVMFPDNSPTLLPHVGMLNPSLVKFTTTDVNDAGNRYRAYWVSKAFLFGQTFQKFGVMAGTLFARASAASIGIALLRNLGVGRKDVITSIAPTASESHVFRPNEDAKIAECFCVQWELGDPVSYAGSQLDQTWALDQYVSKLRSEDESTS